MASGGRTTEEDLREGLKSVGALSALRQPGPMRRENLFAPPPQEPQPKEEPPKVEAREKAPAPDPRPAPRAPAPPRARPARKPEAKPPAVAPTTEASPQSSQEPRGAPVFSDAPTVPMTAEMRTAATLLAAELQRRRTDKSERFTANSIFRVAIERFLEDFKLEGDVHVNTERELLDLARARKPR